MTIPVCVILNNTLRRYNAAFAMAISSIFCQTLSVASSANDLIINKQHGLLIVGFSFSFTFPASMFGLSRANSRSPGSACRKVCTAIFGKIGDKINADHADGKTLAQQTENLVAGTNFYILI